MLKVLLYGYATGVTSSRKLEARLAADVGFMFLAGQARPDHRAGSKPPFHELAMAWRGGTTPKSGGRELDGRTLDDLRSTLRSFAG